MEPVVVGIREFRERISDYLLKGDRPVVVTRHGLTVGYFIPTRIRRLDLDRAALKEAAARVDAMLASANFTEADMDEIEKDFRSWRKQRSK